MLQESLTPHAQNIEFAFVYGSFAKGEEKAASDIDLMLSGKITLDALLEQVSIVERTWERSMNPTIFACHFLKLSKAVRSSS